MLISHGLCVESAMWSAARRAGVPYLLGRLATAPLDCLSEKGEQGMRRYDTTLGRRKTSNKSASNTACFSNCACWPAKISRANRNFETSSAHSAADFGRLPTQLGDSLRRFQPRAAIRAAAVSAAKKETQKTCTRWVLPTRGAPKVTEPDSYNRIHNVVTLTRKTTPPQGGAS